MRCSSLFRCISFGLAVPGLGALFAGCSNDYDGYQFAESGGHAGIGGANGGAPATGGPGSGGGVGLGSSGGSGGGLTPDTSCAAEVVEPTLIPVALFIMQDKSGSMVSEGPKWADAKSAITQFVNDPASAGLAVALGYFPWDLAKCDGSGYDTPQVPLGELPTNAPAIISSLESINPNGYTPLEGALRGVVKSCQSYLASAPQERCAALLVTDGEPTGCDKKTSTLAGIAAAASAGAPPVPVYTMGMSGADFSLLDLIAQAGSTGAAFDVSSGGAASFLAALQAIAGKLLACEFQMPVSSKGEIDPQKVLVRFTTGGGVSTELTLVNGPSACGQKGFFYDDPVKPTKLTLCPDACSLVQNDKKGKVEILLGCAIAPPA